MSFTFLLFQAQAQNLTPSLPAVCRDFSTSMDPSLRVCDFVTADRLKTEVLATLISEQKSVDAKLDMDPTPDSNELDRLMALKNFLFLIEQFAPQKFEEICSLKGSLLPDQAHLVSGCIYNHLQKVKSSLISIKTKTYQVLPSIPWQNENEHLRFDIFINDVLLELAEKSKNDSESSAQKKELMAEVLKIYESDGQSLYAAFEGLCGLKMLSESPNVLVDAQIALNCEKDYLSDLSDILFRTLE